MTPEDVIKTVMSHTVFQVGNDLLNSKVTLLPAVHDTLQVTLHLLLIGYQALNYRCFWEILGYAR